MNLITNLHDIITTQAHIPFMLAGVGLFLWGVVIVYIELRKMR
jgi:hypothetical protein